MEASIFDPKRKEKNLCRIFFKFLFIKTLDLYPDPEPDPDPAPLEMLDPDPDLQHFTSKHHFCYDFFVVAKRAIWRQRRIHSSYEEERRQPRIVAKTGRNFLFFFSC
jgi:hypothetical protein